MTAPDNSMYADILEQPEALRRMLDAAGPGLEALRPWSEKLRDGTLKRIVMTGMGGSAFAIYPSQIYLVERGIATTNVEASELLYYYLSLLDPATLLVMISQSGRSVEIQRLVERTGARAPVVAVTNDLDSPLARSSQLALHINAGPELTVSTKTYTCTLGLLHLVARALSGAPVQPAIDDVRRVADSIERMLPAWERQIDGLAAQLDNTRFVEFLGRGPSRASALTAALITKETAKLPTEGMIGGQFRHGAIEVVSPGVGIVIFAGPERTRTLDLALAADLAAREALVVLVGADQDVLGITSVETPGVNEWTAPIAEIVPIQLLATRLAVRRGIEPGKFRFIQKVTVTE
jgi:glutamine---fructose-6-phosphate transaminase (isomerizing)